ncbi:MAG: hypothetical protein WC709_06260 [Thermoleophilia bacterium]
MRRRSEHRIEGGRSTLERKEYTQEECDIGKAAVDEQFAACKPLVKAVAGATTDEKVQAAVDEFEDCSSTT